MQSAATALGPEQRAEAIASARQSARLGVNDAFSLARAGHPLACIAREYDDGLSRVERAVTINPNLDLAQMLRGHTCVLCSEHERAVEGYDLVIRLSPLDPLMPHISYGRSFALSGLSRFEEGRQQFSQNSVSAQGLGALITNAVGAGLLREAREAASRLLELWPGFNISVAAGAFHTKNPELLRRLFDHLSHGN